MGAALVKALNERTLSEPVRMYILHCVSRIFCYWLPNLLLHTAAKRRWGAQWKIQGSKQPNSSLVFQTVLKNLKDDLITQLAVSFVFHKLLRLGRKCLPSMGSQHVSKAETPSGADITSTDAKVDTPVDADTTVFVSTDAKIQTTSKSDTLGWAGLRFNGPNPSAWTHIWQVAVGYIGFDTMFYWSHRLMHHKRVYKRCHKIHHQFHTPIGLSCSHEHLLEAVIQILSWYLPIGFAGFLNRNAGGLHASTLFYHHCFRWLETVDAHSGYELPFSPFHLIPIFGGARMHDYHHRAFDGNYGALVFWDRICGTNKDFWKEVVQEGGFLVGGRRVGWASLQQ